ncbi:MAG TPA: VTT domain-containing protein [Pseudolabrys sp.]|nr:VTT domain-containing protein [Pseudolabrys sp.]
MSASSPSGNLWRGVARRLLLLAAVLVLALAAFLIAGESGISLESLVRHRAAIDAFVEQHRVGSVVVFIAIYIVTVAFSLPGATFLTVAGGFLFGFVIGAIAAAIGATIGATLIFLIARTALGEPLLRRAGPRARQLAKGFRDDAFSYLLFLRLVPVFPFFLVNLVPAFAGVRLRPFVAATAIGVIPAVVVFTLAGIGLDSVITAQKNAYHQCMAAGENTCRMVFDASEVLTPQVIVALVALGMLALLPVFVKRWRARSRATT